jgi:hypothetical protein
MSYGLFVVFFLQRNKRNAVGKDKREAKQGVFMFCFFPRVSGLLYLVLFSYFHAHLLIASVEPSHVSLWQAHSVSSFQGHPFSICGFLRNIRKFRFHDDHQID